LSYAAPGSTAGSGFTEPAAYGGQRVRRPARRVDGMSESERPGEIDETDETDETERRFVEDLAARGEAVPEGTEPLPPGVTHEITEECDGVPRKVRRRRFSAH
jgi:hypothetical protein